MTGGVGLSAHAGQRMQQRGFRQRDIALVLAWGTPVDDGCAILLLQKDVDEAMRRHEPEIERLHRLRGTTVVIRGGVLVTCYWASEKRVRGMLRRRRNGPQHRRRGRSRSRPGSGRIPGRVFPGRALGQE